MSNKAFEKRVKKCIGGVNLLKKIGFVEKGGDLVYLKKEVEILKEWISVLEKYVEDKVIVV